MSKTSVLTLLGVSIFILAAAFGLFNKKSPIEKLTLTGSSTIAPLMLEIAKRYESSNPNVRIDVQTGGSSRGISDARSGVADIGMVSRNPKSDESDLRWNPIAKDGIAIILHRSNIVTDLTKKQVVDIYTSKITNWSDLGSQTPGKIVVINKAEGRSTLEVFLNYFEVESENISADVIIGDNQQGIKTVANNPQAIAYVSIGTAEYEVRQGTDIKLVRADGVEPTVSNVAVGAYPVSRTLHIVTKQEVSSVVQKFVEYATSRQINDLIEGQFFVPLKS